MGIFTAIKKFLAPQRIDDLAALQHFMESRAAFLVQKSIMEYTQARSQRAVLDDDAGAAVPCRL